MTKAAYAAFYAHFGGLLTGQALSDQVAARAVANTPYELRPSARQHCRLVGSTWLDQDTSGTFVGPGERALSASPGPSRTPRAPSDPNAPKKPTSLSEQLARQTGKSIFLIFSPFKDSVIQKLAALGTAADNWPYQGTINKIIEELPRDSEWTDSETKSFGLRKRSSGTDRGDEIAHLTMDDNLPDAGMETTGDGRPYPTLGHPAARGCKNCFELNIDCDLIDRENPHYPCQHCDEEDEACEPCIEPKLKAACYSCKKGRKGCSYSSATDEKDHAVPCVQCTNDARVCVAGPKGVKKLPSKNGSQTRKSSSTDEDKDPADVAGWDDRKDNSSTSKADDHVDEVEDGKPVEGVETIDKPEGSDELEANHQAESIDRTTTSENLKGSGPVGEDIENVAAEKVDRTGVPFADPANRNDSSMASSDKRSKEESKDKPPAENEDPFADLFEDSTTALPPSGDEQANADVNTEPDEVDQDHIDSKSVITGRSEAEIPLEEIDREDQSLDMPYDTHSGKVDIPEQSGEMDSEIAGNPFTTNVISAARKQKSDIEEKIDPELQKLLSNPVENGDFTDAIHGFMDEDLGIDTDEINTLEDDANNSLFHTSKGADPKKEPPSMPIAPMFPITQVSIFGNGTLSPTEDRSAAALTTAFISQQDNEAFSDECISGLQSLASKAITKAYVENHTVEMEHQQANHDDKIDPTQQVQKPANRTPFPRKRKREGSDEAGPSRPSKFTTKAGNKLVRVTGQNSRKHDALALAAEEFIHDVPPKRKKTFSSKLFCLDDDDDDDEDEDVDGAEDFAFLHRHATESKKEEEEEEVAKEVLDIDTDIGGYDNIWGLASKAADGLEADASSPMVEGFATNGFKNVGIGENGGSASSKGNGYASAYIDQDRTSTPTAQKKSIGKAMKKEKIYKTPSIVDDEEGIDVDTEDIDIKKPISPTHASSPQQSQRGQRIPKTSTSTNIPSSNSPFNRTNPNLPSSSYQSSSSSPPSATAHHHRPLHQKEEEIIDLTAPSLSHSSYPHNPSPSSTTVEACLTASITAKERQLWLARRRVQRVQKELEDKTAILHSGTGRGRNANANGWPTIPYLGGNNGGRVRGGNANGGFGVGFGIGETVDLTDDSLPATAMGVERCVGRSFPGGAGGGQSKKKKAYKEIVVLDDSDDDN